MMLVMKFRVKFAEYFLLQNHCTIVPVTAVILHKGPSINIAYI